MRARSATVVLIALLAASGAFAAKDYFRPYEEGLKAAGAGDWNTVVRKMTEAISANPKEGRVRPYGTIFEEYRPYYYRGIAYFELERYDEALADLKKSDGPGKVKLGDRAMYLDRAESKLAQGKPPIVVTATTATVADSRPPSGPDPAIVQNRNRADQMLREAQSERDAARAAKAETFASTQYAQGMRLLESAGDKRISAATAEEWRSVADEADRAQRAFQAALSRARDESRRTETITDSATTDVMNAGRDEVRRALELYFAGEFARSADTFQRLANGTHKSNSMVWAFLGASKYYNYYLTGSSDSSQLGAATQAFKRARSLKPDLQLSTKYFSPRVRNFYKGVK